MTSPHPHLQELFERLRRWSPLPLDLRLGLGRHVVTETVRAKQELCSLGIHCSSIWYSVDCWLANIEQLSTGNEEVSALYGPGEIFTDLKSLLRGEASSKSTIVISGTSLLHICRAQLVKMQPALSNTMLVANYMIELREQDHWRMELLSLGDQAKVDRFAERYPLNLLPGHICASYLRMTPSRFSMAKTRYNRSH